MGYVERARPAAVDAARQHRRVERELIRERTGEGRKRAMAAGVKFGRKRKLSDYQRKEAIRRRNAGETLSAIAKSYGVAISMISRL
jgi:DNA invertase Pin-like site-specific DNA recombinase